ncbi:MAG: hypothetical protein JO072_10465 [Parafilimonas sp.]|nr:hypothetical protein [Parafilimonas sp.]
MKIIGTFFLTCLFSCSFNGTNNEYAKWQKSNFGKLQFKGKIIKMTELVRNGRYYDIACVQLDYSNVDSFYAFIPNKSFLKISKGKAVIPIGSGVALEEKKVDYVEINMNDSGKEVFYYKGKVWETLNTLALGCPGLQESDLKFCDE